LPTQQSQRSPCHKGVNDILQYQTFVTNHDMDPRMSDADDVADLGHHTLHTARMEGFAVGWTNVSNYTNTSMTSKNFVPVSIRWVKYLRLHDLDLSKVTLRQTRLVESDWNAYSYERVETPVTDVLDSARHLVANIDGHLLVFDGLNVSGTLCQLSCGVLSELALSAPNPFVTVCLIVSDFTLDFEFDTALIS